MEERREGEGERWRSDLSKDRKNKKRKENEDEGQKYKTGEPSANLSELINISWILIHWGFDWLWAGMTSEEAQAQRLSSHLGAQHTHWRVTSPPLEICVSGKLSSAALTMTKRSQRATLPWTSFCNKNSPKWHWILHLYVPTPVEQPHTIHYLRKQNSELSVPFATFC